MWGDGSFTYDKSRDKLVYDYADNTGKRHKERFANTPAGKKQRDSFARTIRAKRDSGDLVSSSYTVGAWVLMFMETYKKPKLRDSSLERDLQSAAKLEPIANIPLDELKPVTVQNLYISLRKSLSTSSVAKVHRLLFGAYKAAYRLGEVKYNPMARVDPVKVRTKKIEIFTFKEILHIYRAFRVIKNDSQCRSVKHDYRMLFTILLTTGMRIGELLALRWENVNLESREINIYHTVSKKNAIHDPKTPKGFRSIPLFYAPLVKKLYMAQNKGKVTNVTGYVFHTASGKPIAYGQVLKHWDHVCKLSGVDKTIHAFRHTFATVALAKGVPLLEVSRILGHAQTSTTVNMYGHAIPNYNKKLLEQFGRSLKIV